MPRLTTAILPATETPSHVKSAALHPSDSSAGVAGLFVITLIGYIVPSATVAAFALIVVNDGPVLRLMMKPGNCWFASFAATLMAPVPAAGAPVRYWLGPLFPA